METKNHKGLAGLTFFATLLCVASIVWIFVQSYSISANSGEGCIKWHEELYPLQIAIFIGRIVFESSFFALIVVFLFKQLKAIKSGVLFPSANVKIMYIIAVCYLIGDFCADNISTALVYESNGAFVVKGDTLLFATMLIVFALLYNTAVKISEENNLTI